MNRKPSRFIYDHKHEKKSRCPQCGRSGKYTRIYDLVKGEYLPERFGRCDREGSCAYDHKPSDERQWLAEYKRGTDRRDLSQWRVEAKRPKPQPVSYHPASLVDEAAANNHMLRFWLSSIFIEDVVESALSRYHVGGMRNGDTIFFQIDNNNNVRAGKIMRYLSDGHRDHSSNPTWLHCAMGLKEGFHLSQVPFGYHLPNDRRTAVVESEKSAIIMSFVNPSRRWIAVGGSTNLESYINRGMIPNDAELYPDDDVAGDKWFEIANRHGMEIINDWTTLPLPWEAHSGKDIADYALLFCGLWRQ